MELQGKQYVGLWLPQSYNHVANWNIFSMYHILSAVCPAYTNSLLNFLRKKKAIAFLVICKTAYPRGFFFLFVCLQKMKKVISVYKSTLYS